MNSRIIVAGVLLFGSLTSSATEGINLIGLGPVQKGTAGAGVASPKDSTWLILNPAGLTQISRRLDVSFEVFAPTRDLESSTNPGVGRQTDDSVFYVPSVSATFRLNRSGTTSFGVGVFGSSGMGVDYKQPRIGMLPSGDRYSELQVSKSIMAIAHDFGAGWRVGAGPLLVVSRMRTDMFNGLVPSSRDWSTAYGGGFIVGLQKRWNGFSVGASYISEQWMGKFDEYRILMPDSLNLPPQFQVGFAVDIRPGLEIAADYRFLQWEQVPMWSETAPNGFGWENQHIGKLGVTWDASDKLTLRSGFSHGNSPIQNEDVFPNALFPAVVETHLAAGFSYALTADLGIHATYMHAFKKGFTDDGTALGGIGKGTSIHLAENTYTFGLGYQF